MVMKNLFRPKNIGKNRELPQILAIFSACVAGICNGLLFAWTSPAIPELLEDETVNITFDEASYFTVLGPVAMALSAPLFSILIDIIGRKKSVLIIAVPQIMAFILTAVSRNIWVFYLSRISAGIGDAALFASVPIYVCEIAQPKVRGTWGNVVSTSMYTGIFLINVIGAYNRITMIALICGCFPILHVLFFAFMPESPYYLLMKGKDEEAKESLQVLRWRKDVDEELLQLKSDIVRQTSESGTMKDLLTIDSNRRALILCTGIRIAQQFSGLPAFEVYTRYMFQQAGGNVSEKESAMIFTAVLVVSVVSASFIVEKAGRRPLMILSCFGCAIVLSIETIYFTLEQFTDYDLSNYGWVPLTGMIGYIILCSSGIGILPTLMLGELFSASVKGKASSIMNIVLAGCALFIPKLFQVLTTNYGIFAPFCFFSLCSFASGVFSYFYMIETKGKTLEEIQQELKGNPKEKILENSIKC